MRYLPCHQENLWCAPSCCIEECCRHPAAALTQAGLRRPVFHLQAAPDRCVPASPCSGYRQKHPSPSLLLDLPESWCCACQIANRSGVSVLLFFSGGHFPAPHMSPQAATPDRDASGCRGSAAVSLLSIPPAAPPGCQRDDPQTALSPPHCFPPGADPRLALQAFPRSIPSPYAHISSGAHPACPRECDGMCSRQALCDDMCRMYRPASSRFCS